MSNVIITRFYMTLEETVGTYVAVRNESRVLHIIDRLYAIYIRNIASRTRSAIDAFLRQLQ